MRLENLPYGQPIFFNGEYEKDKLYPLYVQMLTCDFSLKKGKIPTIQLKNNSRYGTNEYIENSTEKETLCLTSIDLDLFKEHYNLENVEYHAGWKFKGLTGLFTNYIDYWSNAKIQAKKDKNDILYTVSKLMLNNLYGKFALNPKVRSKSPYLTEEEIIKYKLEKEEIRDSIYIPIRNFYNILC